METATTSAGRRAPVWYILPLFVSLTFLVFGAILVAEYAYDSTYLIERLKGPPPTAFGDLLNPSRFGPSTGMMSWRPLSALIMLFVDLKLFGATPSWSHGLNLLVHGLNAFLLFVLVRRIRPGIDLPAWAGVLLFLVHPLNSEAVLCAGFRGDLLATTFMLGSCLLFVRWFECRGRESGVCWPALVSAAALFGLGLLAKEIAVVALVQLPLLVFLVLPRRKGWFDAGLGGGALLAVFAVFFMLWKLFQFPQYPNTFLGGQGRLMGLANMLVVFKEVYLAKLLWPWPLRVDYAFEPVAGLADVRVWTAAGAVLVLLLVTLLAARRDKLCAAGLVWYLVGFLPVSQIVPVPDPVAERFCYVPMLGVALFAAGLVAPVSARAARRALALAGLVLAVVLSGVSLRRSLDWRDDVTLNIANWEQSGDRRPRALESLAGLYLAKAQREMLRGDNAAASQTAERARACLDELVAAEPDSAAAHRLYAMWYLAVGKTDMAKEHITRALELAPDDQPARDVARLLGVLPKE